MFHWEKQIEDIFLTLESPSLTLRVKKIITAIGKFNKMMYLPVKTIDGVASLEIDTIVYFDVQDGVVTIRTLTSNYQTRTTLRSLIGDLPEGFIRISRNTVVNLDHLIEIKKSYGGNYTGVLVTADEVVVSRRAVKTLKQALQEENV